MHLAGEPIAQRWTQESKQRIRSSRERGTERLVEGLAQSEPRPGVLVSASAVGYYGARGDERLDETTAGRGIPRERVHGLGARGRAASPSGSAL